MCNMTKTLSIVTSNIRYAEPKDEPHSWSNRRDFLAERLLDFGPDLLATQEGRKWQVDEITERLIGLTRIDAHRDWIADLMYPCLFYNEKELTLRESGDIWLSKSPSLVGSRSFGSEFPRLCTWATFEERLFAVNVHLDNEHSDTRVHQIRVLLQQIRQLQQITRHALLMGDFNEAPDGPVRATIGEEWPELTDPWLELGLEEESSHHCFGESIDYGSRVDWILSGPSLVSQQIFLDKSQTDDGIYPSDHFILKARFTLETGDESRHDAEQE